MITRFHKKRSNIVWVTVPFLLACLIVSSKPAAAAAEDGNFAVRGIGASRCGDVLSGIQSDESSRVVSQLTSWISGYLSHANRVTEGTYESLPIQDISGIATVVVRLCENNNEALLEPIMAYFMDSMERFAQSEMSELETVSDGGREISIRQNVLVSIQRELIERGILEAGNDDGLFGPVTQRALVEFQSSVGLDESGLPTAPTLYLLFGNL